MYSGFNFEGTLVHVFRNGVAGSLSDSYNVGILMFLVFLGTLVAMMNRAGGSAAFGRWAEKRVKPRTGAQLATIALGTLIFIDDYFNCLTVGSVMRPVTDKNKISRAKLAYLIDATAAPICIIAPVSSWAAAVSGFVDEGNGLELFIKAIPFNFYALLTFVMMVFLAITNLDFGPMARHERNATENDDIFSGMKVASEEFSEAANPKGRVVDLVLPILVLIVSCVVGMIYSGGFFQGTGFVEAFSGSDASVGLMLGSAFSLIVTVIYYLVRRVVSFKDLMGCLPEGFKAMVPAILILTLAWSLKAMTDSLGAREFVAGVVKASARGFKAFLPAIVFVIGCLLSCHRYQLGHLRHPDPHHPQRVPPHGSPGRGVRQCLHGGGGVRRPLLAHLRHHHHGFRGRPVRPRDPCVHPVALRLRGGGGQLCNLYLCGLRTQRPDRPASGHRADARHPAGCAQVAQGQSVGQSIGKREWG